MYILYNVDNDKKSNIKGYWIDNNKLYVDNIHITYHYQKPVKEIKRLFLKNEKSVFVKKIKSKAINKKINTAYCYNSNGVIDKYKKQKMLEFDIYADINNIIIDILLQYGGCTVYKKTERYIIEIWYN
jgi:hypothetical protein